MLNERFCIYIFFYSKKRRAKMHKHKQQQQHNGISELVTSFSALERRLDTHSPTNIDGPAWTTLHYTFHAHRAGILVMIDYGVVELVPFVNTHFDNRLVLHGTKLGLVLPSGTEATSTAEYFATKAEKTRQPVEDFIPQVEAWWFNGHVVCNVPAPSGAPLWSARGLTELYDMIASAAALPGTPQRARLVLNKRDAPLLPLHPPLHPLWRSRAFTRPLSLYGGPRFHDVLVPTPEHWALACTHARDWNDPPPWHVRASRAVFRGTATGPGVTLGHNQRLALAAWGLAHTDIADVALTALSMRDRIVSPPAVSSALMVRTRVAHVMFMDATALEGSVRRAPVMSPQAQAAAFKYQIYVDGHSASSRLAWLLLSQSLVLMVESPVDVAAPDMWLTRALALRPHEHYVPVRSDLHDLELKIRWAREHDADAQRIALAGCAAATAVLQQSVMTRAVADAISCAIAPIIA
jgi:hypothetical protein